MESLTDEQLYELKHEKLTLYWTKYIFLRKRIHSDILYLFVEFKQYELINFLNNREFDGKIIFENLLKLMNIIKNLEENITEKNERKKIFFKVKRKISNETILADIDKLYNSLTFQVTRTLK